MNLDTFASLHDYEFDIEKSSENQPTSMTNYHYHNFYEIYYLYNGEKYYFIKDKSYHIKKGNLVFINKYDIHYTTAKANQCSERMLITFKDEFLKEFAENSDIELLKFFKKDFNVIEFSLQEQMVIENLLDNMLLEYQQENKGSMTYLKAALTQLLIIVGRQSEKVNKVAEGYMNQTHKTISEITGYVNNNFSEDISLGSISDKFFISTYYFSRTFKQITGLPFIDYLNSVRVKEAQKLLHNTDMNITKVGESVGFKNTTHFGRVFKKIMGMSPMEYKKRL